MYKKEFYVIVDEDSFPFISIELDDVGTSAKDSSQEHLLSVLSKSPTVVRLDGISPKFGTAWDGTNFEEFTNNSISINSNLENENLEGLQHFSLVVNGKHSSSLGINTITAEGEMIAAALSSNPTIIGRLVS